MLSRTLIAGSVLFLGGVLPGCQSQQGDPQPMVQPDILGPGQRISEVVTNPPLTTNSISLSGLVVTAIDTYDETGKGGSDIGDIYLADLTATPGPNEGILAYGSSFSPPTYQPLPGDVVDIMAGYQEFRVNTAAVPLNFTSPELSKGTISLRFDGSPSLVMPTVIPITDLVDYMHGRQWLSMLVTLQNVKLNDGVSVDTSNRASIPINPGVAIDASLTPVITNELFDLKGALAAAHYSPAQGDILRSVTGIVTLFASFQIAPRSIADIQF